MPRVVLLTSSRTARDTWHRHTDLQLHTRVEASGVRRGVVQYTLGRHSAGDWHSGTHLKHGAEIAPRLGECVCDRATASPGVQVSLESRDLSGV